MGSPALTSTLGSAEPPGAGVADEIASIRICTGAGLAAFAGPTTMPAIARPRQVSRTRSARRRASDLSISVRFLQIWIREWNPASVGWPRPVNAARDED